MKFDFHNAKLPGGDGWSVGGVGGLRHLGDSLETIHGLALADELDPHHASLDRKQRQRDISEARGSAASIDFPAIDGNG